MPDFVSIEKLFCYYELFEFCTKIIGMKSEKIAQNWFGKSDIYQELQTKQKIIVKLLFFVFILLLCRDALTRKFFPRFLNWLRTEI